MFSKLRVVLLTVFSFLFISFSQAQTARLTGKVSNNKNEPLVGVSVRISGTTTGATTDVDGFYTLSLLVGKKYTIEISSAGYESKTLTDVEVVTGQVNELNIILEIKAKTEENVIVSAKTSTARKETVNAVITFQKNTNTVASVISAESIRRSPDRNTGEVLKRLSGVSLLDGKFIIVRGLADRYNQAVLNGVLLTSTEPDRKTFSFDLIPASMIDNIVVNKAFVPEYPGEWAGGLIQVNTKDVPAKNFLNIQIGAGFNTQTTGKSFLKDNQKGKTDWIGVEDGSRGYPEGYTTKYQFGILSAAEKATIGKNMRNHWVANESDAPLNNSVQINGGFNSKIFGKKVGGTLGLLYNRAYKTQFIINRRNIIDLNNNFTLEADYSDTKHIKETTAGAFGGLSVQLNPYNKISAKAIINVNSTNAVTARNGVDISRQDSLLRGNEFVYKQNIFFTTQLVGEHTIVAPLTLKWYGAFNILDGYIPDQRRLLYSRKSPSDPYTAVIANSLAQQSGSRIFQSLSDYVYTAGGDLSYKFDWFGQKQTVKSGYMLQVKDRLYDALLFAYKLPKDNPALRLLTPDKIFAAENFGDGNANSTLIAFDAIVGNTYRYMANTILNAGFLQFDNSFSKKLRVVWGARAEHYDQVVGSIKTWDPRHTHTKVFDILPGINATYKANTKTNFRISASQTVIRPELRELAALNLYDFELNASVQGNPSLERTKVTNTDIRYELYPAAGEFFTVGAFFKHFDKPIEQMLQEGSGGASTFLFANPESAIAYGAEFEFRKKLAYADMLKNFTLQGNFSYIYSRVKDEGLDLDRTMQGQSPYVLNLGLQYDLEKIGFSSTILFNRIGQRIYLVGDKTASASTPDTYEAPRSLLDFQMAKKMLKNKAEIRLTVADILNQLQNFYQNRNDKTTFQEETDKYRFTRKPGTTFSLTFNYSL